MRANAALEHLLFCLRRQGKHWHSPKQSPSWKTQFQFRVTRDVEAVVNWEGKHVEQLLDMQRKMFCITLSIPSLCRIFLNWHVSSQALLNLSSTPICCQP